MIRVFGFTKEGWPRDLGIKNGTIEGVRKELEKTGFQIVSITEQK